MALSWFRWTNIQNGYLDKVNEQHISLNTKCVNSKSRACSISVQFCIFKKSQWHVLNCNGASTDWVLTVMLVKITQFTLQTANTVGVWPDKTNESTIRADVAISSIKMMGQEEGNVHDAKHVDISQKKRWRFCCGILLIVSLLAEATGWMQRFCWATFHHSAGQQSQTYGNSNPRVKRWNVLNWTTESPETPQQ